MSASLVLGLKESERHLAVKSRIDDSQVRGLPRPKGCRWPIENRVSSRRSARNASSLPCRETTGRPDRGTSSSQWRGTFHRAARSTGARSHGHRLASLPDAGISPGVPGPLVRRPLPRGHSRSPTSSFENGKEASGWCPRGGMAPSPAGSVKCAWVYVAAL
jgi:hypothetical protein